MRSPPAPLGEQRLPGFPASASGLSAVPRGPREGVATLVSVENWWFQAVLSATPAPPRHTGS